MLAVGVPEHVEEAEHQPDQHEAHQAGGMASPAIRLQPGAQPAVAEQGIDHPERPPKRGPPREEFGTCWALGRPTMKAG